MKSQEGSKGAVVYIQDLHCNLEVQNNIAAIIRKLAEDNGLTLAGIEGASGTVDVSQLAGFPVQAVKESVGQYLLTEGKIGGAEYYAATAGRPMVLEGVENAACYATSREAVKRFLTDENQGAIFDLREALEALKPKIYSRALQAHDGFRQAFRKGGSLLDYSLYLVRAALKAGIDLQQAPHLTAYVSKRMNVFGLSMDGEALVEETDWVEGELRSRLYKHPAEQELDAWLARLDVLEQLINISISQEGLTAYRAEAGKYSVQALAEYISRQDPENALEGASLAGLESGLTDALAFYTVADQRSEYFVSNLAERMRAQGTKLAVLVTGGYHSDDVQRALAAQGLGYICVKPRLSQPDLVNPYFSLLRGRQTPLEKLLAQNQNILALPILWPFGSKAEQGAVANQESQTFSRMLDVLIKLSAVVNLVRSGKKGMAELGQAYKTLIQAWTKNHAETAILWEGENHAAARVENGTYILPFNLGFTAVVNAPAQAKLGQELLRVNLGAGADIRICKQLSAEQRADVLGRGDHGDLQGAAVQAALWNSPLPAMVAGGSVAVIMGRSLLPMGWLAGLRSAAIAGQLRPMLDSAKVRTSEGVLKIWNRLASAKFSGGQWLQGMTDLRMPRIHWKPASLIMVFLLLSLFTEVSFDAVNANAATPGSALSIKDLGINLAAGRPVIPEDSGALQEIKKRRGVDLADLNQVVQCSRYHGRHGIFALVRDLTIAAETGLLKIKHFKHGTLNVKTVYRDLPAELVKALELTYQYLALDDFENLQRDIAQDQASGHPRYVNDNEGQIRLAVKYGINKLDEIRRAFELPDWSSLRITLKTLREIAAVHPEADELPEIRGWRIIAQFQGEHPQVSQTHVLQAFSRYPQAPEKYFADLGWNLETRHTLEAFMGKLASREQVIADDDRARFIAEDGEAIDLTQLNNIFASPRYAGRHGIFYLTRDLAEGAKQGRFTLYSTQGEVQLFSAQNIYYHLPEEIRERMTYQHLPWQIFFPMKQELESRPGRYLENAGQVRLARKHGLDDLKAMLPAFGPDYGWSEIKLNWPELQVIGGWRRVEAFQKQQGLSLTAAMQAVKPMTMEQLIQRWAKQEPVIANIPQAVIETQWRKIDLRRLNRIDQYQGTEGFFELARDLELAVAHGWLNLYYAVEKNGQAQVIRIEEIKTRALYQAFSPELKKQFTWQSFNWPEYNEIRDFLKQHGQNYFGNDGQSAVAGKFRVTNREALAAAFGGPEYPYGWTRLKQIPAVPKQPLQECIKRLEMHPADQLIIPLDAQPVATSWGPVDLTRLNDIRNYQNAAGTFDLVRDINLAVAARYLPILTGEISTKTVLAALDKNTVKQQGLISQNMRPETYYRVRAELEAAGGYYWSDEGQIELADIFNLNLNTLYRALGGKDNPYAWHEIYFNPGDIRRLGGWNKIRFIMALYNTGQRPVFESFTADPEHPWKLLREKYQPVVDEKIFRAVPGPLLETLLSAGDFELAVVAQAVLKNPQDPLRALITQTKCQQYLLAKINEIRVLKSADRQASAQLPAPTPEEIEYCIRKIVPGVDQGNLHYLISIFAPDANAVLAVQNAYAVDWDTAVRIMAGHQHNPGQWFVEQAYRKGLALAAEGTVVDAKSLLLDVHAKLPNTVLEALVAEFQAQGLEARLQAMAKYGLNETNAVAMLAARPSDPEKWILDQVFLLSQQRFPALPKPTVLPADSDLESLFREIAPRLPTDMLRRLLAAGKTAGYFLRFESMRIQDMMDRWQQKLVFIPQFPPDWEDKTPAALAGLNDLASYPTRYGPHAAIYHLLQDVNQAVKTGWLLVVNAQGVITRDVGIYNFYHSLPEGYKEKFGRPFLTLEKFEEIQGLLQNSIPGEKPGQTAEPENEFYRPAGMLRLAQMMQTEPKHIYDVFNRPDLGWEPLDLSLEKSRELPGLENLSEIQTRYGTPAKTAIDILQNNPTDPDHGLLQIAAGQLAKNGGEDWKPDDAIRQAAPAIRSDELQRLSALAEAEGYFRRFRPMTIQELGRMWQQGQVIIPQTLGGSLQAKAQALANLNHPDTYLDVHGPQKAVYYFFNDFKEAIGGNWLRIWGEDRKNQIWTIDGFHAALPPELQAKFRAPEMNEEKFLEVETLLAEKPEDYRRPLGMLRLAREKQVEPAMLFAHFATPRMGWENIRVSLPELEQIKRFTRIERFQKLLGITTQQSVDAWVYDPKKPILWLYDQVYAHNRDSLIKGEGDAGKQIMRGILPDASESNLGFMHRAYGRWQHKRALLDKISDRYLQIHSESDLVQALGAFEHELDFEVGKEPMRIRTSIITGRMRSPVNIFSSGETKLLDAGSYVFVPMEISLPQHANGSKSNTVRMVYYFPAADLEDVARRVLARKNNKTLKDVMALDISKEMVRGVQSIKLPLVGGKANKWNQRREEAEILIAKCFVKKMLEIAEKVPAEDLAVKRRGLPQPLNLSGSLAALGVSGMLLCAGAALPGLSLLVLPFFLMNLAKTLGVARILAGAYPGLGNWLNHLNEPVGAYDAATGRMVDPETGEELLSAPWFVTAHEQYAHRWAQAGLKAIGIDITRHERGSPAYWIFNVVVCEVLAHGLDWLALPWIVRDKLPLFSSTRNLNPGKGVASLRRPKRLSFMHKANPIIFVLSVLLAGVLAAPTSSSEADPLAKLISNMCSEKPRTLIRDSEQARIRNPDGTIMNLKELNDIRNFKSRQGEFRLTTYVRKAAERGYLPSDYQRISVEQVDKLLKNHLPHKVKEKLGIISQFLSLEKYLELLPIYAQLNPAYKDNLGQVKMADEYGIRDYWHLFVAMGPGKEFYNWQAIYLSKPELDGFGGWAKFDAFRRTYNLSMANAKEAFTQHPKNPERWIVKQALELGQRRNFETGKLLSAGELIPEIVYIDDAPYRLRHLVNMFNRYGYGDRLGKVTLEFLMQSIIASKGNIIKADKPGLIVNSQWGEADLSFLNHFEKYLDVYGERQAIFYLARDIHLAELQGHYSLDLKTNRGIIGIQRLQQLLPKAWQEKLLAQHLPWELFFKLKPELSAYPGDYGQIRLAKKHQINSLKQLNEAFGEASPDDPWTNIILTLKDLSLIAQDVQDEENRELVAWDRVKAFRQKHDLSLKNAMEAFKKYPLNPEQWLADYSLQGAPLGLEELLTTIREGKFAIPDEAGARYIAEDKEDIDLTCLNTWFTHPRYQGKQGLFYLARDIDEAIAHGYFRLRDSKKLNIRTLYDVLPDEHKKQVDIQDMTWKDFFRIKHIFESDPERYLGMEGLLRLAEDGKIEYVDMIYLAFGTEYQGIRTGWHTLRLTRTRVREIGGWEKVQTFRAIYRQPWKYSYQTLHDLLRDPDKWFFLQTPFVWYELQLLMTILGVQLPEAVSVYRQYARSEDPWLVQQPVAVWIRISQFVREHAVTLDDAIAFERTPASQIIQLAFLEGIKRLHGSPESLSARNLIAAVQPHLSENARQQVELEFWRQGFADQLDAMRQYRLDQTMATRIYDAGEIKKPLKWIMEQAYGQGLERAQGDQSLDPETLLLAVHPDLPAEHLQTAVDWFRQAGYGRRLEVMRQYAADEAMAKAMLAEYPGNPGLWLVAEAAKRGLGHLQAKAAWTAASLLGEVHPELPEPARQELIKLFDRGITFLQRKYDLPAYESLIAMAGYPDTPENWILEQMLEADLAAGNKGNFQFHLPATRRDGNRPFMLNGLDPKYQKFKSFFGLSGHKLSAARDIFALGPDKFVREVKSGNLIGSRMFVGEIKEDMPVVSGDKWHVLKKGEYVICNLQYSKNVEAGGNQVIQLSLAWPLDKNRAALEYMRSLQKSAEKEKAVCGFYANPPDYIEIIKPPLIGKKGNIWYQSSDSVRKVLAQYWVEKAEELLLEKKAAALEKKKAERRSMLAALGTELQPLNLPGALAATGLWAGIWMLAAAWPLAACLVAAIFIFNLGKLAGVLLVLLQKYPEPGQWAAHWRDDVGAYDPKTGSIIDPVTGEAPADAPWFIKAHEAYAHGWVRTGLKRLGLDLAQYERGSPPYLLAELLAHTLDWAAAPVLVWHDIKAAYFQDNLISVYADFDETITKSHMEQRLPISQLMRMPGETESSRKKFENEFTQAWERYRANPSAGTRNSFFEVLQGRMTRQDLEKLAGQWELNPNFISVLEKIKQTAGKQRVRVNIISRNFYPLIVDFLKRPEVRAVLAAHRIHIGRVIANHPVFNKNYFVGIHTQEMQPNIFDKTAFIRGRTFYLADAGDRASLNGIPYFLDVNQPAGWDTVLKTWKEATKPKAAVKKSRRVFSVLLALAGAMSLKPKTAGEKAAAQVMPLPQAGKDQTAGMAALASGDWFAKEKMTHKAKKTLYQYQRNWRTGSSARALAPELAKMTLRQFLAKMKRETKGGRCRTFAKTIQIRRGTTQKMIVWEYPDGTIIRLKPLGDKINPAPSYIIEVKIDHRNPYTGLHNIAFKVDRDGKAVPKSPDEMSNPYPKNDSRRQPFTDLVMRRGHQILPLGGEESRIPDQALEKETAVSPQRNAPAMSFANAALSMAVFGGLAAWAGCWQGVVAAGLVFGLQMGLIVSIWSGFNNARAAGERASFREWLSSTQGGKVADAGAGGLLEDYEPYANACTQFWFGWHERVERLLPFKLFPWAGPSLSHLAASLTDPITGLVALAQALDSAWQEAAAINGGNRLDVLSFLIRDKLGLTAGQALLVLSLTSLGLILSQTLGAFALTIKSGVLAGSTTAAVWVKPPKRIYFFKPGKADGKADLAWKLGGKGANLAEMARHGLPVPPGFTIIAEVTREVREKGITSNLRREIMTATMHRLSHAARFGKRWLKFGDPERPLLVSVRSGAPVSIPGLMLTITNVGLNRETVKGLAAMTKDEEFAWKEYVQFIEDYSVSVMGLDRKIFQDLRSARERAAGTGHLGVDSLKYLAAVFEEAARIAGAEFPQDTEEQLMGAIRAVMASWDAPSVREFRKAQGIPDTGTGVTVQQMVFGNLGVDSGAGVVYTRHPVTGQKGETFDLKGRLLNLLYGEIGWHQAGEAVVSGRITPAGLRSLAERLPAVYVALMIYAGEVEKIFKAPQDMEIVIQEGELYLVQTRSAKNLSFPLARIQGFWDMVQEGLLQEEEAVGQMSLEELRWIEGYLKAPQLPEDAPHKIGAGLPAAPGIGVGRTAMSLARAREYIKAGEPFILVKERTEKADEELIAQSLCAGVVDLTGGMLSHAASRLRCERRFQPCITAVKDSALIFSGSKPVLYLEKSQARVREGEWLTLDGNNGNIHAGKIQDRVDTPVTMVIKKGRGKYVGTPEWKFFEQVMKWIALKEDDYKAKEERIQHLVLLWLQNPGSIEDLLAEPRKVPVEMVRKEQREIPYQHIAMEFFRSVRKHRPDLVDWKHRPVLEAALKLCLYEAEIPQVTLPSKLELRNLMKQRISGGDFPDDQRLTGYQTMLQNILGALDEQQRSDLLQLMFSVHPGLLRRILYNPRTVHALLISALLAWQKQAPGSLARMLDALAGHTRGMDSQELHAHEMKMEYLFARFLGESKLQQPREFESLLARLQGGTLAFLLFGSLRAGEEKNKDIMPIMLDTARRYRTGSPKGNSRSFWEKVAEIDAGASSQGTLAEALKAKGLKSPKTAKTGKGLLGMLVAGAVLSTFAPAGKKALSGPVFIESQPGDYQNLNPAFDHFQANRSLRAPRTAELKLLDYLLRSFLFAGHLRLAGNIKAKLPGEGMAAIFQAAAVAGTACLAAVLSLWPRATSTFDGLAQRCLISLQGDEVAELFSRRGYGELLQPGRILPLSNLPLRMRWLHPRGFARTTPGGGDVYYLPDALVQSARFSWAEAARARLLIQFLEFHRQALRQEKRLDPLWEANRIRHGWASTVSHWITMSVMPGFYISRILRSDGSGIARQLRQGENTRLYSLYLDWVRHPNRPNTLAWFQAMLADVRQTSESGERLAGLQTLFRLSYTLPELDGVHFGDLPDNRGGSMKVIFPGAVMNPGDRDLLRDFKDLLRSFPGYLENNLPIRSKQRPVFDSCA